jgi:hypothetical protein
MSTAMPSWLYVSIGHSFEIYIVAIGYMVALLLISSVHTLKLVMVPPDLSLPQEKILAIQGVTV